MTRPVPVEASLCICESGMERIARITSSDLRVQAGIQDIEDWTGLKEQDDNYL